MRKWILSVLVVAVAIVAIALGSGGAGMAETSRPAGLLTNHIENEIGMMQQFLAIGWYAQFRLTR